MAAVFYGPEQAEIHHARFGDTATGAARLLLRELRATGIGAGTVVDLGSGSGILARALSDAGYDVRGTDISPAMVDIARRNAPAATFSAGSVHDTEIPSAVAVTAIGEVLNYATDQHAGLDALASLAAKVRAALEPGGIFLFDIATPGRGGTHPRRERFQEGDGWAIGVQWHEDDSPPTLTRDITIFTRQPDETYRRVEEHHVLHLYTEREVVAAVEHAGFSVDVLDGYDGPVDFTGWKVFVAR
jgi:methylase of polypeptide subunit release factors